MVLLQSIFLINNGDIFNVPRPRNISLFFKGQNFLTEKYKKSLIFVNVSSFCTIYYNNMFFYSALNSTTTLQPRQLKKGSHIKPVGTNMAQHQDRTCVPIQEKTESQL